MSKLISIIFRLSPALIGLAILTTSVHSASAESNSSDLKSATTNSLSSQALPESNSLEIAPVNAQTDAETLALIKQATDAVEIKPGDWAYETLLALATKYDCDNLPTAERSLSRDEFATSLTGCMEAMEELIAKRPRRSRVTKRTRVRRPVIRRSKTKPRVVAPPPVEPEQPMAPPVAPPPPENTVSQQDIEELKQLTQAFRTELQGLDARLQALDAKTAEIKEKSFSTTSKLKGEVIFALTGVAGRASAATPSNNTIFSNRVRLNFVSSFTGKDELVTRLQARNSTSFASPTTTNMTRLGFEGNDQNTVTLHRLQYRFPVGSSRVFIATTGKEFNDQVYTFNPEHQAAALGSITRFGRFNPIYRLSGEGAGITVDTKFDQSLGLVLGYAVPQAAAAPGSVPSNVDTAGNPSATTGLFNGSNVFFSQLELKPSSDFNLGLIYARSYHVGGTGVSGNNGSVFANNPFAGGRASANHYSALASVNLSKDVILSGWGGLTQASREGAAGSADIWNYAATLAFKDFGGSGNTLGFVLGMPPKVTTNSGATAGRVNNDTSLHIEAFYKAKMSDNLYITPGILMLTNPEHNAANPTEYLGTVRTTFNF
jgi:Carbohydrate-selective porin, OprB family